MYLHGKQLYETYPIIGFRKNLCFYSLDIDFNKIPMGYSQTSCQYFNRISLESFVLSCQPIIFLEVSHRKFDLVI